uniref:Exostosin domain-containing protein n=1 Tax=Steinernema glaseri TaxID=37863 RepID=A0A1I8AML9_9BILA
MFRVAFETAKLVRNPMESEIAQGRRTLYDSWIHYFPSVFDFLPDCPEMTPPTGSSDHAAFLNFIGVPIIDFTYRNASWREYPLYHTLYETPFLNEHIFDHNRMSVHRAVGEYWALLAKAFADADVLPVNVTVYAQAIALNYVPKLKKDLQALAKEFHEAKAAIKQVELLARDAQVRVSSEELLFSRRPSHHTEPFDTTGIPLSPPSTADSWPWIAAS